MISFDISVAELEIFLLIIVRVTMFVYAAPFFGMNNVPNMVKISLGIFMSYLIYYTTMPHEAIIYETVLQYTTIVLREAVVGLTIGWAANICSSIVLFAGRMVDMEIGFSMVNAMDPTTRENATITGLYYQYTVFLMLIVTGMHRYLITALVQTYELIPINQAVFQMERIVDTLIMYMTEYVNIGFRICLPIFCVVLITNVVLGIMAKVSPQMNMFAVGMQIKVLVGLGILFMTTTMLPYVSDYTYTQMKRMVVSVVEGMMP